MPSATSPQEEDLSGGGSPDLGFKGRARTGWREGTLALYQEVCPTIALEKEQMWGVVGYHRKK